MFINTASFILSLIRDLGPGGFFFFFTSKNRDHSHPTGAIP